jgi:hypothetical protein
MVDGVAGLAKYSGKLSLELLGWEGIASFPDLHLFTHQVIHANPHSTDDTNGHCISILFFQRTHIAFHNILIS